MPAGEHHFVLTTDGHEVGEDEVTGLRYITLTLR